MGVLSTVKYSSGNLEIIDQLLLPHETKYIPVDSVENGWQVINKMQVRGAPAIAIVGSLSLAVELFKRNFTDKNHLLDFVEKKLDYLCSARPTAVNMKTAAQDLKKEANNLYKQSGDDSSSIDEFKAKFISHVEAMLKKDLDDNKAIGDYGAEAIIRGVEGKVRILTHCNTGSLATSCYGTALGVVRSLHKLDRLEHIYCTETRPYNQGARLTAYEIVSEEMPGTLICDSAVGFLMQSVQLGGVVVGADRVAANGDTANKIGTYQIAVLAKHNGVPFYVAAPLTTIDLSISSGKQIIIEERPPSEMTHIGGHQIAVSGINCWNPAFDVTPAELICGIITEYGVFKPTELAKKVSSLKQKY